MEPRPNPSAAGCRTSAGCTSSDSSAKGVRCCFKSAMGNSRQDSECGSKLERDVIKCIHSMCDHVQELCVSQALPRTPKILFLNLTLRGGGKYCVEVTEAGWRVTSLHHDSMQGDIPSLMLHIKYFDSLKALIDYVSATETQRKKSRPLLVAAGQ
ncbi:unnamed protein product [Soboliphyme baturini]|uniref:DUF727 domain-containing protein n=1 Tax=Soboliphyme baturini TaxID=241478 RepID=A0A183J326_9BILA|nr:unnamed protein product [Soboliphyme baturini]